MDITERITELITDIKELGGNSLAVNKATSHLKDAWAWARLIEDTLPTAPAPTTAECICPDGGRHRNCPVHQP